MELKPLSKDLQLYLESSDIVDYATMEGSAIRELANHLEAQSTDKLDYIKNAFEYVRDHISHSADSKQELITIKASEVLREKHGICFAKSHLLAALLRYKGVPTGLCYQKLILDDETATYLIYHGLNGVYIEDYDKWIRLDARGNKAGVDAQFSLDEEKLAFPVRVELGEEDIPVIFYEPDQCVIDVLRRNETRTELWKDLPSELAWDQ